MSVHFAPKYAFKVIKQGLTPLFFRTRIGEAKKWHGLNRARYRGRWKMAIQAFILSVILIPSEVEGEGSHQFQEVNK